MAGVLRRLLLVVAGLLVAAGLLEGLLRLSGQGVRSQAGLFVVENDGAIGLAPCASDRVRRPDGLVTTLTTDRLGLRAASACAEPSASRTLVLGDSQVFGLGVAAEDSFAARMGALNGGVPDYAIGDALARGRRLLSHPELSGVRRVLVVVNQSNDFDDGTRPVGERNVIRGGYLLRQDRLDTRGAGLWSTPLVHSALFYTLWARFAPPSAAAPGAWLTDPGSLTPLAASLGEAVRTFANGYPTLEVQLVWLPADLATSEANARTSVLYRTGDPAALSLWERHELRDALAGGWGAPIVDLTPVLTEAGAFLAHDFHLSERGHAAVAEFLSRSGER